jgi:hypothetical protein
MNASTASQLARIQNRPTAYEIVLTNGTKTYGLGFSVRTTKRVLLSVLQASHLLVVATVWPNGEDGEIDFRTDNRKAVADFNNGWIARYSGRTQRDAILGAVQA